MIWPAYILQQSFLSNFALVPMSMKVITVVYSQPAASLTPNASQTTYPLELQTKRRPAHLAVHTPSADLTAHFVLLQIFYGQP